MFNTKNKESTIIYVDNQFASRESIRLHFERLNMTHRLKLFSNGQEVVDYFDQLLSQEIRTLQPVALMMLDINVPILHGLEVTTRIK